MLEEYLPPEIISKIILYAHPILNDDIQKDIHNYQINNKYKYNKYNISYPIL